MELHDVPLSCHGVDYLLSVRAEETEGGPVLVVECEEAASGERWSGEFSSRCATISLCCCARPAAPLPVRAARPPVRPPAR